MISASPYVDAPRDIAGFDPTRLAGDCWYDSEAAEKAVAFFHDCLVYLDGARAGDQFMLQDWQADIVRTVFGWKRTDGWRRFRHIFWFVPRKNGKTTIAAGMALKCLVGDAETRAQCYCAAADREQASILFDMAKEQVQANDELLEVLDVRDYNKRILFKKRRSKFQALAASDAGGHGMNLHFGAYDEYHLWKTGRHKEMATSLHTSTGTRDQPLELFLTTAGFDTETICFQEYQTAKKVRDGLLDDDAYLPIIYEASPDDDWTDPAVWAKANPNLDVTISTDYIRRECLKAQRSAIYENDFKRLHLNMWTQQKTRWLQMELWRNCQTTDGGLQTRDPVGGYDLAATGDFCAWAISERVPPDGIRCRMHYWLPANKAKEYERQHALPIANWVRAGLLTLIPGDRIEHSYIHRKIREDRERWGVETIAYDPWHAEQLRINLEAEGFTMIECRQGFGSLNGPSKELERQVLGRTLDHGGDPVLDWMAGNAVVKLDENANIRPIKESGNAKIDGVMALIMSIHALEIKFPRKPSIYETPGMLSLT